MNEYHTSNHGINCLAKILNLEITLTSGEEERQVERLKRRISEAEKPG